MNELVYKTSPYPHQRQTLEKMFGDENHGLFCEMGTGKTKIVIDEISNLYRQNKIRCVVVIAPKGVYRNWYDKEIPTHMPNDIQHNTMYWTSSPTNKDKEKLQSLFVKQDRLMIFIVNTEALSTQKLPKYLKQFLLLHGDAYVAVDESTAIKSVKAKRTKTLLNLRPLIKYRRILTGSPVTQSVGDLYSQVSFLDSRLLGGVSYTGFKARYLITKTVNLDRIRYEQVVGQNDDLVRDELLPMLQQFCTILRKKDCLDLPPKIFLPRAVELTEEQKEHYGNMKQYAMTFFEDNIDVTVNSVLTVMTKLQQITCGFINDEDGKAIPIKNNRLDTLIEVLSEMSGNVIIWSNFRFCIQDIQKRLKKEFPNCETFTYYGSTTTEERSRAVERFQESAGPRKFFIGNPSTAGFGLTLTSSSEIVYYSNGFNLEHRLQSEDRAHRIGQKNAVTYVDLFCPGTIDEKVMKALSNKIDIAAQVMGSDIRKWF